MKYTLYYSYINDEELLQRSINSVKDVFSNIIVTNHSEQPLEVKYATVIEPPVPLSFSQSMNWFKKMSLEKGDDYFLWAHTDMIAPDGAAQQFKEYIETNFNTNWGIFFTSYDILSAYHTKNLQNINWDARMFPNYFADNDYHRLVTLAGLEIKYSGIKVIHENGGSSTIKNQDLWHKQHIINFPLHKEAYKAKWGNYPPNETFETPFNL